MLVRQELLYRRKQSVLGRREGATDRGRSVGRGRSICPAVGRSVGRPQVELPCSDMDGRVP